MQLPYYNLDMPTIEGPKRKVTQGPTGDSVRSNVARLRREKRLTAEQLVERLALAGHKVPRTAISEIETGGRRVTVDDLVALALALEVTPNTLLLPDSDSPETVVSLTSLASIPSRQAWAWAQGQFAPTPFADQDSFRTHSLPSWLLQEQSQIENVRVRSTGQLRDLLSGLLDEVEKASNGDN